MNKPGIILSNWCSNLILSLKIWFYTSVKKLTHNIIIIYSKARNIL